MKHLFILFSLLISFFSLSQGFISSTPIIVGDGFGYYHPQIEITNDDKPLVLWVNSLDKNLYSAKYDADNSFLAPVQINPDGLEMQTYDWSGADLSIEGNNVYVTFRSLGYETGHVYVAKSTDNGTTYGDTVRVDNLSTGFGQYPDIAVLNDTVWVTFMDHNSAGLDPQYVVARSTDGGLTFSSEVIASEIYGNEACDCCQPEIIVNDDFVIVYFRNNDNNIRDIKGVISYDRGLTFTNYFSVDDHQWVINACPSTGPDARFINDSTSITVYKTTEFGDAKLFLNQYNHVSNTSENLSKIYDSNTSNLLVNYPQVAVNGNVIGVVWEGKGDSRDVFFNFSESGANGFNATNTFNLTDAKWNQVKPDIAISDSKFHIVYADKSVNKLKYVSLQSLNSIENINLKFDIDFFPNPVSNQLNINIKNNEGDFNVIITNAIGERVFENSKDSQSEVLLKINTTKWSKGVYFVTIKKEKQSITNKIIKQ